MATEVGQPDLVYKFMDLAHHQQVRAAARAPAALACVSTLQSRVVCPAYLGARCCRAAKARRATAVHSCVEPFELASTSARA